MTEPFTWPIRIYWEDTDGGGVVYYANYLKFMERARTELLRSLGVNQSTLAAGNGIVFAVVGIEIEYLKPARLDDELVVTCEVLEYSRVAFAFRQEIYRERVGGELLTRAVARAACLDSSNFKPRRVPEELLHGLDRYQVRQ